MSTYKLIGIMMLFTEMGCQHKHEQGSYVAGISSVSEDVSLRDLPNHTVMSGNLSWMPVVMGVKIDGPKVWVKEADEEAWRELTPLLANQPTYVYDKEGHQLRFQWCKEGWAYAIASN